MSASLSLVRSSRERLAAALALTGGTPTGFVFARDGVAGIAEAE